MGAVVILPSGLHGAAQQGHKDSFKKVTQWSSWQRLQVQLVHGAAAAGRPTPPRWSHSPPSPPSRSAFNPPKIYPANTVFLEELEQVCRIAPVGADWLLLTRMSRLTGSSDDVGGEAEIGHEWGPDRTRGRVYLLGRSLGIAGLAAQHLLSELGKCVMFGGEWTCIGLKSNS